MGRKNSDLQGWFEAGFRGLAITVCGLIVYSYQELNVTMKELISITRAIELRVTTIEVDRAGNKEGYKTLIVDVQEMKTKMAQMDARWQTFTDFVAKISAARIK